MIREIAGRQNHSVKLLRKLQQKKHRRERGLLVCEGMDLLSAAVEANAAIREVLVRSDLVGDLPRSLVESADGAEAAADVPDIGVCDEATMSYASALGGASDVIFACVQPRNSLSDLALAAGLTVYLEGVGDPGNVGTIIRSAVAFGTSGVVCSPGTADPFSPKAMRAGMGAQFSLPVVAEVTPADLTARLTALEEKGGGESAVWVADPYDGAEVHTVAGEKGVVVVLGDERSGPSGSWPTQKRLTIPQERIDSLNVAMAGTVIMYEWWRAARQAGGGN